VTRRILQVVTNVGHYDDPSHPTGLWLSELAREGLQRIAREIWERGGVVSSVCHGYCGLLNTTLSDGSLLVAGRKVTGFAWQEEVLALVDELVPYNAEEEMKKRGARYEKAKLPFVSYAVTDGRLVTGQNPGSAKETAQKVVALL
jgi:putative intracellular protease/amidase